MTFFCFKLLQMFILFRGILYFYLQRFEDSFKDLKLLDKINFDEKRSEYKFETDFEIWDVTF